LNQAPMSGLLEKYKSIKVQYSQR